jgi:hypothetical protein
MQTISNRKAFAILAGVVALGASCRFFGLGFYDDDYVFLSDMAAAGRNLDVFAAVWNSTPVWSRPLTAPLFGSLFLIGGETPGIYHLVLRVLELTAVYGFFHLVRGLGASTRAALLAAALAALYPNHDATRNWVGGIVAVAALSGAIWAMVFHLRWQSERGKGSLAVSLLLLAASTLLYESATLLVLALPALEAVGPREEGETRTRMIFRRIPVFMPMLSVVAVLIAYQRGLAPFLSGEERHPMSLSLAHALGVVLKGAECTFFNRLLHSIARALEFSAPRFAWWEWTLLAASAGAVGAGVRRAFRDASDDGVSELWKLGLFLYLLGYAPYFFDATYSPSVFSKENRVNLAASYGGALVFTWLLLRGAAAARPGLRKAAIGGTVVLLVSFLAANWAATLRWAEAYRIQREILERSQGHLSQVSGVKNLLLFGFEDRFDSATVFQSTYDYDRALRLRGVSGLHGWVGQGRTRFEDSGALVIWFKKNELPYEGLFAFHVAEDRFSPIPDLAAGEAFLKASQP